MNYLNVMTHLTVKWLDFVVSRGFCVLLGAEMNGDIRLCFMYIYMLYFYFLIF